MRVTTVLVYEFSFTLVVPKCNRGLFIPCPRPLPVPLSLLYAPTHVVLHHNLDNRPMVLKSPPNVVVRNTENQNNPDDQHTVIHRRRRRRRARRPEAEEHNHNQVHASEGVDRRSEPPADSPRAPDQLTGLKVDGRRVVRVVAGGFADGASAPPPEKERAGGKVGGVEAGDGEGENVVEDHRGAEIDQGQEAGDNGRDRDGVEGDRCSWVDLRGTIVRRCHTRVENMAHKPCSEMAKREVLDLEQRPRSSAKRWR